MNKINILWALSFSLFYTLAYASENIELVEVADFGKNYTYYLKDIAPEQIVQIAVNTSFAYLLTKKGNLYAAAQPLKDLSNASWKMLPASSDISLIALFPEEDELNKLNIMYATHNYIFKDRMFLYDSAEKKSVPLTRHNRAIYKIGSVFDQYIKQSCALSASTFPSMQLRRQDKISPLKNAYLMYAQDKQLVYAELQSNKKDDGTKSKLISVFEKITGKKLSYAMHIVWDTTALDSLTLIDKEKKAPIKTDPENELIVDINNTADLPLVAVSNVQDKIKTVAVVMQNNQKLKIIFNYWLDETVVQEMLKKLPDLTNDQSLAITLENPNIRSYADIKKYYYNLQKDSITNRYAPFTSILNRKTAEPVQAVSLTYASLQPTLDNILNNKNSHILMLVYSKTIECFFTDDLKKSTDDLQNSKVPPRVFTIDIQNKTILTTFFDKKQNVLYCVTKDQAGTVLIESKDVGSFF